jgi:hypothetical protein
MYFEGSRLIRGLFKYILEGEGYAQEKEDTKNQMPL